MTRLMRFASVILCPILLAVGVAGAAGTNAPSAETLARCREMGVVCLSPAEYRLVAEKIVTLEREVAIAKAKRLRRLGPSVGLGVVVEADGGVGGGVVFGYGWRF